MMISFKWTYYVLHLVFLSCIVSCNKKDFLDKKPASDIFIPTTLEDFQFLLDNERIMNETPVLGELSADNFYLLPQFWQLLPTREHNTYIWAADIYEKQGKVDDWNLPYKQVFYANVVLDGLSKLPLTSANEQEWKRIKGTALFMRAYAFYNLAQVFAPVYDSATAGKDPGIPLRLQPDIAETSVRATVQQTYNQLLSDLKEAGRLLPEPIAFNNRNRPCKPAAFAMLARTYLSMRTYKQAGDYADSSLRLYNKLINYDTVSSSAIPFTSLNIETLYQSRLFTNNPVFAGPGAPACIVDSLLYRSYTSNDLRRNVFYIPTPNGAYMKGSYNGLIFAFSGLATDEVFLIRAECYARAGNTVAAMDDLNTLLRNRWKANLFIPFTATTADEARALILEERRKELPFRGVRWADIRRFNKEGAAITLTRKLNGVTYELRPGERRFVLPIPPDVIDLTGMEQNPR